jgi:hypothetical protein
LDGARKYSWAITYDGFGRVKREAVTAPDSTIVLNTLYTLDGKQQLQAVQTVSKTCPDLDVSTGYSPAPSNFLRFSYFLFSSFLAISKQRCSSLCLMFAYDSLA